MNGLLTLVQTLATFIVGPFGVSTIIVACAASFLCAACHLLTWHRALQSLIYGGLAYSTGWMVTLIGA